MTALRTATSVDLPLIPEGEEAREWARRELADPAYAVTEPTPFDRAAQAVGDVIASLFSGSLPAGLGLGLAIAAIAVLVALVAVAILIWGRPRLTARSQTPPVELFGEVETRSAGQLRTDAAAAAARREWDDAVTCAFRALARGLAERTLIEPGPGATVHAVARAASRAFPDEATTLDAAADAFDDVRYLRRPATESSYHLIADLDRRVASTTPRLPMVVSV